jgi:hypothetical protein
MFADILDFLYSNRIIDLFEWAKKVSIQNKDTLPGNYIEFLDALSDGRIHEAINVLQEISVSELENEKLVLAMNSLKEKAKLLNEVYEFTRQFNKKNTFVNIVLDKHILIGQTKYPGKRQEITSIEQLESISNNPNQCYHNGSLVEFKGVSSVNNLQAIMNNKELLSELGKISKYEKVYMFISQLNETLQKYFSENKIGIIVFNDELYLIKFIPMFAIENIKQQNTKRSVNVLQGNFGTIIGVLVNQNLSFGDLVVFEEQTSTAGETELYPLISLDMSLFKDSIKEKEFFNLEKEDDINLFINSVSERIDMGVNLLSSKKQIDLKDRKDLYVYTKIELHKIENELNINTKISKLTQLYSFSQEPELEAIIKEKLEMAYLLYFRECFTKHLPIKLTDFINKLLSLKLFKDPESFNSLINLYAYGIEKYSFNPQEIIETIQILDQNWKLTESHYKILEKIHLSALAVIIQPHIVSGNIQETINIIDKYSPNSKFIQKKIDLLLIDVLFHVYKNVFKLDKSTTTSANSFIQFFRKMTLHFDRNYPSLMLEVRPGGIKSNEVNESLQNLQDKLASLFHVISNHMDFLAFLGEESIVPFLRLVFDFPDRLLKPQIKNEILNTMLKNAPLAIINNGMEGLGKNLIDFLIAEEKERYFINFITDFTILINKTAADIGRNRSFIKTINTMFEKIMNTINKQNIREELIIPFITEVRKLLSFWYKKGKMPLSDFDLHKAIIKLFSGYLEKGSDVQMMYYIISIKDMLTNDTEDWMSLDSRFASFLPEIIKDKKAKNQMIYEAYMFIEKEQIQDLTKMPRVINIFKLMIKYRSEMAIDDVIIDNFVIMFSKRIEFALIYFIDNAEHESFEAVFRKLESLIQILSIQNFKNVFAKLIEKLEFVPENLNVICANLRSIYALFKVLNNMDFQKSEFFKFSHFLSTPMISNDSVRIEIENKMKAELEIRLDMFVRGAVIAASSYSSSIFPPTNYPMNENKEGESITEIFIMFFQLILFNMDQNTTAKIIKKHVEQMFYLFKGNRLYIKPKLDLLKALLSVVSEHNYYDIKENINEYTSGIVKLYAIFEYLKNRTKSNINKKDTSIEMDVDSLVRDNVIFEDCFYYNYILGMYFDGKRPDLAEKYFQKALRVDCPEYMQIRRYTRYIIFLNKSNRKDDIRQLRLELPAEINQNAEFQKKMQDIGV